MEWDVRNVLRQKAWQQFHDGFFTYTLERLPGWAYEEGGGIIEAFWRNL